MDLNDFDKINNMKNKKKEGKEGMRKKVLTAVVVSMVMALFGGIIYAGTAAPDVIKMEEPSYKHKKGIVEFSHKNHSTDYKLACGECHHDDKNKPLELKEGDDVKKCIECHNKPGEKPKGKKLSDAEELKYHAEALHENCKGCHKKYDKEHDTKDAPTTCSKCHPKTKK